LKRLNIYENVANHFSFLVDFDVSGEQLNERVRLLMKHYPLDIDINLANETKFFRAYIKEN
jgi:5S rRNA maturation endonuclease (ribonuclease M5)